MHAPRAVVLVAVSALAIVAVTPPANAGVRQVSGVGVFDLTGSTCPAAPGFDSYPPIVLTGDLEGCWYTKIDASKDNGPPSGVYLERGRELFVGTVNGGAIGTFTTTYRFESTWDPSAATGSEVRGRCQHPIATGSGTGGLEDISGRLDFKDVVSNGSYLYRGHLDLP